MKRTTILTAAVLACAGFGAVPATALTCDNGVRFHSSPTSYPEDGATDVPTNTKLWGLHSGRELVDPRGETVATWTTDAGLAVDVGLLEPHTTYAIGRFEGAWRFTTGDGPDLTPPPVPTLEVEHHGVTPVGLCSDGSARTTVNSEARVVLYEDAPVGERVLDDTLAERLAYPGSVHWAPAFSGPPDLHVAAVDYAGNVSATASVRASARGCAQSRGSWLGGALAWLLAVRVGRRSRGPR